MDNLAIPTETSRDILCEKRYARKYVRGAGSICPKNFSCRSRVQRAACYGINEINSASIDVPSQQLGFQIKQRMSIKYLGTSGPVVLPDVYKVAAVTRTQGVIKSSAGAARDVPFHGGVELIA